MKKFIIMLVLIIIVGFNSIVLAEDELKLKSDSVIVIDNLTGRVLYQKNAKKRVSIASLTKIMTSIMLVSNCDIDEKITIPKQATLIGGSEAGVRVGGEVTAKDLLYSMLLPSGNDAAYTVGFHIGNGNIKNFAYLMTKKAHEIGAYDTSFANPHGLDNENHYSTAYDVAKITRYALKNKYINTAVNTRQQTVNVGGASKTLNNTNRLLKTYTYADGVKTGFTNRC